MPRFAISILTLLVGAAFGCSHGTAAAAAAVEVRHGADSVESLVDVFLEALGRADRQRLRAISFSFEEFETIVWPRLDASRPETNLDARFVWSQYEMRDRAHFERLIERFGGRAYRLDSLEFRESPKHYDGFVLHDDPVLRLVAADGTLEERQLFGAIVETNGQFKIYGYSTD